VFRSYCSKITGSFLKLEQIIILLLTVTTSHLCYGLVQCSVSGIYLEGLTKSVKVSGQPEPCIRLVSYWVPPDTSCCLVKWVGDMQIHSGVVAGCGLDDQGLISSGGWNFSLHHHVQTVFGTHQVSYPMGTKGKAA
jgi:hypothetical protein